MHPAALTARVATGERLPTLNKCVRQGWRANQRITKDWREAANKAWHEQAEADPDTFRVLAEGPISVTVKPVHSDGRMPDVGACLPAVKAAIDALTPNFGGVGLIPDDDPEHLKCLVFLAPVLERGGGDALEVTVTTFGAR